MKFKNTHQNVFRRNFLHFKKKKLFDSLKIKTIGNFKQKTYFSEPLYADEESINQQKDHVIGDGIHGLKSNLLVFF